MNILEKILEEIEEYEKKKCSGESLSAFESGINRGCLEAKNIIRSHMDDMSRPRQYRHLKRKNSILFLVFLDFPHFFIHSG